MKYISINKYKFCKAATGANRRLVDRAASFNRNMKITFHLILFFILLSLCAKSTSVTSAAELTLELGNSQNVTFVGAIQRWDQDGNHRRQPDEKAKIDAPAVDTAAENISGGRWIFKNLPVGKYDLIIIAKDRIRIEGFQYAPVKELDPFIAPESAVEDDTREFILDDIKKSPHYENKVMPLCMAGDKKAVRVLVMLIRDKPTSYEGESPGAATMRHEIWQYSWNYGAWQKEKRTKVIDRILMHRDQLRKWTWLWDEKLGGIEVKDRAVNIKYELSTSSSTQILKGLYPY
jgi:hypothetical protein